MAQFLFLISSTHEVHAENIAAKDTALNNFELILPNLYRFSGACNSYLIKSDSSAILINDGSETIADHLNEIGVSKIDWILHTCYHKK